MHISRQHVGFSVQNLARAAMALFARPGRALAEMRGAITARRALAAMDARMLADIGVSPSERFEEVGRRPWDLKPRG